MRQSLLQGAFPDCIRCCPGCVRLSSGFPGSSGTPCHDVVSRSRGGEWLLKAVAHGGPPGLAPRWPAALGLSRGAVSHFPRGQAPPCPVAGRCVVSGSGTVTGTPHQDPRPSRGQQDPVAQIVVTACCPFGSGRKLRTPWLGHARPRLPLSVLPPDLQAGFHCIQIFCLSVTCSGLPRMIPRGSRPCQYPLMTEQETSSGE